MADPNSPAKTIKFASRRGRRERSENAGFTQLELGPEVQRPVPKQRVAVINAKTGGNWADYAVVSADRLIPIPDDLPDEQVAFFFINPASATAPGRNMEAIVAKRKESVYRGNQTSDWLEPKAAEALPITMAHY